MHLYGRPLELILARQWAALLSVPVLLFDEAGQLVYFNDAAGLVLGRSFAEAGDMERLEWEAALLMEDESGAALQPTATPLGSCLDSGLPAQGTVSLRGMDGHPRRVTITALPVWGLAGTKLGAIAMLHNKR